MSLGPDADAAAFQSCNPLATVASASKIVFPRRTLDVEVECMDATADATDAGPTANTDSAVAVEVAANAPTAPSTDKLCTTIRSRSGPGLVTTAGPGTPVA